MDLFSQSQKPFQFSFSVILHTGTDVRIWDHLSGQAQSCHTVWILLLLSAPGGIKLSLHFWGASVLSWFYWGKHPPLITPHWHTALLLTQVCSTNNMQGLCAEVQNTKWSGEMTRLRQVGDLNSKAQLNSMWWGHKVLSPQIKCNYSPSIRIHAYLHSWLLNIEIYGIQIAYIGYEMEIQVREKQHNEHGRALQISASPAHSYFYFLGMLAASLLHSVISASQGFPYLWTDPSPVWLSLASGCRFRAQLDIGNLCKTGKRKSGVRFWCNVSLFAPYRMWTSLVCFPSRRGDTERLKVLSCMIVSQSAAESAI